MHRLTLSLITGLSIFLASAQDCIDFSNYTTAYVDSVTNDDVNFPDGTAFISEGDLSLLKHDGSFYQGIQGDSALFYVGYIALDVSASNCPDKELVFNCGYVEGVVIDGDTVYNGTSTPAYYQGSGFEFEFDGQGLGSGEFVISGDFDEVVLLSQTNVLWDVCLECISTSSGCVDFGDYTTAYVDSITNDDVNFPDGSAFITAGVIELIKMPNGIYQGIQGDTALFYIGDIGIDVSGSSCTDKELTFMSAYVECLIVDGDTIYNGTNTPAYYQGNGYEVFFDGQGLGAGGFTITGNFDNVLLKTQTNFLWDLCFDCVSTSADCIDFGNYTTAYVDSITSDNINFPYGSTFISGGDIELKKMFGAMYQGIQGDTALFYIGDLLIDVANSPCNEKELTFSCAYVEALIVDGDTVYNGTNTPSFYQGNGWSMGFNGTGLGSGQFTISGDFNQVVLKTQTNILWDVCLSCDVTLSNSDLEPFQTDEGMNLYPNPTSGMVNLSLPNKGKYTVEIFDSRGSLISYEKIDSDSYSYDLTQRPKGIYFVNVVSNNGWQNSKKVIKQ